MEKGNSDYPWDDFNSVAYAEHNYSALRDDDHQLMIWLRDFFTRLNPSDHLQGLDVGAGSNLYPTFSMLPWCDQILQWERSAQNVAWLLGQRDHYGVSWDPFWEVFGESPPYQHILDPRQSYSQKISVRQGSIFDLPSAQWDIGTMFFVAESLSWDYSEFELATQCFIRALKSRAPFCAAFMENSTGYEVAGQLFPAVSIDASDLEKILTPMVDDLTIQRIDAGDAALREGYSGMLLASGLVLQ